MKQAFLYKGNVIPREVQMPDVRDGHVLVRIVNSCVSAGTEMSSVKQSKEKLYKKALAKPTLVFKTLKIGRERGLKVMLNTIIGATGSGFGTQIGYTAAGIVEAVGNNCEEFSIGQAVAVAGVGYANHAEYVCVPKNLTVPIPNGVSFEDASTVALGSIAMQGVRRLEKCLGETIIVMGLGFLGQLTVQMLKANGCNVIGIDINKDRLGIAKERYGIRVIEGNDTLLVNKVLMLTDGAGADGVIFTASTSSNIPLSNCFKMLRKKGRLILVGVSGMTIDRNDIYQKEIDFKIATSYGPGRYDSSYEETGIDYPREYVRFTENRNMRSYLDMLADGSVDLCILDKKVYPIENVSEAYNNLAKGNPPMITLLSYENNNNSISSSKIIINNESYNDFAIPYAIVGAGSYAKSMHLPNLSMMSKKYKLIAIMNRSSAAAAALATQYNAIYYTTDIQDILNDDRIRLVMICTRHDTHVKYAIDAMRAGKDVFVEKPPALNKNELLLLMDVIKETKRAFLVGYNRRFSSYAQEIKKCVSNRSGRLFINYTMNAGYFPLDSWIHSASGGGRIIGEGCHIIDLLIFLTGSKIEKIITNRLSFQQNYFSSSDNVSTKLIFSDGSIAIFNYISVGAKSYPKETMTIYYDGKKIELNDYQALIGTNVRVKKIRNSSPDKGQKNILLALYNAVTINNEYPIPLDEIADNSLATFTISNM